MFLVMKVTETASIRFNESLQESFEYPYEQPAIAYM